MESVKAYLRQYRSVHAMLEAKRTQLIDMEMMIDIISYDLTRERIQAPPSDKTARAAVKLADMKKELERDIDHLLDILCEITKAINSVNDLSLRAVLFERYVNLKKWEEIALMLGLCTRQVLNMHNKAIKEISEKYKKRPAHKR